MWKLLVLVLMLSTPCRGVKTSCQIPAVEEGQDTTLTCSFSDDVSILQRDFKVHFYRQNTTALQGNVLDCIWLNGKPECKVHDCCKYDNHVNNTLKIRVLNVTQDRVGRYVCFVLPAGQESYQFCNLTIKESIPVKESKNNINTLAALVVIVIIAIVIVVFGFLIWRRRRNPKKKGHLNTWSDCHINMCRKNTKEKNKECSKLIQVDEESNSPKPSSDNPSESEGQLIKSIHEPEKNPLTQNEHEDEFTHEYVLYINNRNVIKSQRVNECNATQHGVPAERDNQSSVTQHGVPSQRDNQSSVTQHEVPSQSDNQSSVTQHEVPTERDNQSSVTQHEVPAERDNQSSVTQHGVLAERDKERSVTQHGVPAERDKERDVTQQGVPAQESVVQNTMGQEKIISEGKEVHDAIVHQNFISEGIDFQGAIAQGSVTEGNEVPQTFTRTPTTSSVIQIPSSEKRGPPLVPTEEGTITHALMQPIEVRRSNTSGKKKSRLLSKSKKSSEQEIDPNAIMTKRYNEVHLPPPTLFTPSYPDVEDDTYNKEQSNRSSRYKDDTKGELLEEEKQKSSEAYKEKTDHLPKTETKREKKERQKSERKELTEKKKKEKAEQKKKDERKKIQAKEKKEKQKAEKMGKIESNKVAEEESIEENVQEEQPKRLECKVAVSDRNIDETDSFKECEAKEVQGQITTPSETPQEVLKENTFSE